MPIAELSKLFRRKTAKSTMLDNRALAVNLVSTFLWGYTAKETLEILDKFAGK